MTTLYLRRTPVDTTPAPCIPSQRLLECAACSRWMRGGSVKQGHDEVVIDASTVAITERLCPMFRDEEDPCAIH